MTAVSAEKSRAADGGVINGAKSTHGRLNSLVILFRVKWMTAVSAEKPLLVLVLVLVLVLLLLILLLLHLLLLLDSAAVIRHSAEIRRDIATENRRHELPPNRRAVSPPTALPCIDHAAQS